MLWRRRRVVGRWRGRFCLHVDVLLVFHRGVLRVDIVQPIDNEHVPVVPGERFRLVPLYRVRAHGNVVRAQRFAGPGHAQILARPERVAAGTAVGRLVAGPRAARFVQVEFTLRQPFQRLVSDQQTPLNVILSHL